MTLLTKKAICPYDCPASCVFLATTENNRVVRVSPDPDHPVSQGMLCRKMQHYTEEVNSDQRILTPLKRIGKKGEGLFAPISWDAAIAEISNRWKSIIKEYGAEAIAYCYYSGVMSSIQRHCCEALFHRMGACRLVKTLCSSAKSVGYADVVGNTGCLDPRELKDSDFYLVWGSNMPATRLPSMKTLADGKREGKKVIQVEVYGTPMAEFCDETILIRPGTDGALALAMMHVLGEEGYADVSYLNRYSLGYDIFKETLHTYSPEWAENITGISADTIRHLARSYAKAKAPAIILGSGPSRYGNGAMTTRLITLLSLFTGAWQHPGGGLCGCSPLSGSLLDTSLISRPDFLEKPTRQININQLSSALVGTAEYPALKALFVNGANPANSVSNQSVLLSGLAREDLFTVVHERFLTDTARYADLILPATFSVEQSDIYLAYGYCTMAVGPKIIQAPGEAKSNWDVVRLLAKALEYEDAHFQQSEEEFIATLLEKPTKVSVSLKLLENKDLVNGGSISLPFADHNCFGTSSGKFYFVNPDLPEPLPRYIPCHGGPEPLHLISVPSDRTLNSIYQHHPQMAKERGPMTLIMNPEDAATRGIYSGDYVLAQNDLAQVEFIASISDKITRGAVAAVGTFAINQSLNGLTCNALHHARLSDRGAATTMNDNTIEVTLHYHSQN
ncbi:MAG: molybdopterin-dependent oxidoreductase [Lachnospiraceae bacterium]|nr:molybdopterin-dependent oxidoreductase [Lachnospiraceae bacterium]